MMLISAENLGIKGDTSWRVKNVNLSISKGEIVTMIGPNGSGKSTIAKALLRIISPDEGQVIHHQKLKIGYVPQSLQVTRAVPMTLKRFLQLTESHSAEDIDDVMALVGLTAPLTQSVSDLSGGQFQRALIARALLLKPDLMILDEPVQGVDFKGEVALYELITQIRDNIQCGMLLISHDLHIVISQTDRVICMNGHICCEGSPSAVIADDSYLTLFGPKASEFLALYQHDHDHHHHHDDDHNHLHDAKA
ncbi:MAG: ATP-binding cassette domain-containing protein [Candidatus Puniceispirillaceae bacterium]